MMKSIGIDGCHKGWFLVSIINNKNWTIDICSDIQQVWDKHQDSKLILIDIPIGLPYSTSRLCDIEARKVLKERRSSVFPAPSREAVYAHNYEKANKINHQLLGKKLSIQAWNISNKIREVDKLLLEEDSRSKIRESHPEICFWSFAGGRPISYPKKSEQGLQERLEVLQNIYPYSKTIFNSGVEKYRCKDLAKDDILDAIALAITSSSPSESLCTIPEQPERDLKNLPMEIVYTNRYL